MSQLWVPPRVSRELRAETAKYQAELGAMVSRVRSVIDDFNPDLKRIDRDLEMIYAPEDASAIGLVPGRYHILKHVPGGPPSLIPIVGPNGEFVEPTSRVFDLLHQLDLQNTANKHERRRRQEEAERAAVRRRQAEAEERQEEMRDRYNAAFRASVSMSDAAPWTQTARARRGPR